MSSEWGKAAALLVALTCLVAAVRTASAGGMAQIHRFDGVAKSDHYGWSVCGAGDVNRDGYDDVIVGAHAKYYAKPNYARVLSGKDGKLLYALSGTDDGFGCSVSGAGDVNADGYDDVIVGAIYDDTNGTDTGRADVFSGKDGKVLYSFHGTVDKCRFGWSVSGAGDVNADGYDDVVVGAYHDVIGGKKLGSARVYSGKDGKVLHTILGASELSAFGMSVCGAGDVNADGYADFIVGAPNERGSGFSGTARVYSGKDGSVLLLRQGVWNSRFGETVSGGGDVNSDGYADVIVGAVDHNEHDGSTLKYYGLTQVFSGKDGKTLHEVKQLRSSGGAFAFSVSDAGDFDGDGYADFIVGREWDEVSGQRVGSATVYSGKDGGRLAAVFGDKEGDGFAWSVAGAGDVNGDGNGDVLVGAWAEDYSGSTSGSAFVHAYANQPKGSVAINAGDAYARTSTVTLNLTYTGQDAKVTEVRMRNAGGGWSNWVAVAATRAWTLTAGEGTRTVEVEFRDALGVVSDIATDSIVLDSTPPAGSVLIDSGSTYTRLNAVMLSLFPTDTASGVADVRAREEGGAWGGWTPSRETMPWTLSSGDGVKVVQVEFRDAAGNVSTTFGDTILLDQQAPSLAFTVNEGRPYVPPLEDLFLDVEADDPQPGSGTSDVRVSFDAGASWSAWLSLDTGPRVNVPRPDAGGSLTAQVVVRDEVGNVSAPVDASLYLAGMTARALGTGAKCQGSVSPGGDVDEFAFDLVKGDALSVTVKGKLSSKGKTKPILALDLLGPGGTRLVFDRYPSTSKKPLIKKFQAPATGRYVVVLRLASASPVSTCTYKLTAKVKQARENKKAAGTASGAPFAFDAVDGSVLKGKIAVDGIVAGDVRIVGPGGLVAFQAKEKNGRLILLPTILDAGTGRYEVYVMGGGSVTHKLAVKLAKNTAGVIYE